MNVTRAALASIVALALLPVLPGASAQWNPAAGQWGKIDPADLRVMTWNVQDGICSSNAKVEGANNWTALARIVAAMRPDVLILTEMGDNDGNGTGSGVDSVANLTTTIGYFLHGGNDSFNGNSAVTAWVQKYAPAYDLPNVFVTTENDGFNRNVILSRFPFLDLNGDTKSKLDDIPTVSASAWAPGGDGGIRGFQFAEIDLPAATYPGNLVFGGAHLKAGSQTSDHDQRILATQNVSYVLRYWYNGNGGSVPDPLGKIADSPAATIVLPANTPIVLGGDWNEDELTNGTKGPAEWLTQAQTAGGATDGTDRDGTDMVYDAATNFFSGSRITHSGGSKLDYLAWQDSLVALRLATVFYSGSNPAGGQPPELSGYPSPSTASTTASDHRPVIADLRLPIVDCNGNGVADTTDISTGASLDANGNQVPDECESTPPAPFCFPGLGGVSVCPCGNTNPPSGPDRGCNNSAGTGGARLLATGASSLSNDTLALQASSMLATATCIFLQGDQQVAAGASFGDGIRCTGGSLKRLAVKSAAFGGSSYPAAGDLSISAKSAALGDTIAAGQQRWYQTYYRDPDTVYACALPNTYNITNGIAAVWSP